MARLKLNDLLHRLLTNQRPTALQLLNAALIFWAAVTLVFLADHLVLALLR